MLNTVSAKLTGTPGESGWAQVHEFTPEDPEKAAARGHLFAVVATKRLEKVSPDSGGELDLITAGRELIGRLHEEYFGDLSTKPFNALRNAVEKVTTEFRESWGDVEIAACSVVSDIVYSAASGGSQVVISRGGVLGTILASHEGEVVSASGYPKSGDVMLLATKPFFDKVSQGVIKAGLQSPDPASAVESFAPSVLEGGEEGSLGATVIKFEEKQIVANIVSEKTHLAVFDKGGNIAKGVASGLAGFVGKFVKNFPQRKIYVKPEIQEEIPSQSKKMTFSVAIILLLILLVSIGFGIRQKRINDLKNKYQGILVQAQSEVDQAISLASVSPERSRELFSDSEQKLKQILDLKVKDPKIDNLEKKIEDSRSSILGEYVANTDLFLDLTLLSSGFRGDALSASGGTIYVLDKNGKRILSVEISTKKSAVVATPSVIDSVEDLTSYEDRVFILSSDGIYEVSSSDKTKVVDKTWSGGAKIAAFTGNMYILDESGNAIYRYQGQGNTFDGKESWLAAGTSVDFSGLRQWIIDGSIYALYPNSRILKYSLGSPQNFSISGIIPEIGNIDAIFTDADSKDIYLLDRAGKRVVAIDKDGNYKAQYISDEISNATGLVVSEVQKKIILLTGDKLLSIDIKHL